MNKENISDHTIKLHWNRVLTYYSPQRVENKKFLKVKMDAEEFFFTKKLILVKTSVRSSRFPNSIDWQ